MNISMKLPSSAMRALMVAAMVVVAGLSVPAAVRADDTEVFFPPVQTNLNPVNPNIMFVIDTSGSMSGTDGQTQTRLQRVQTAFNQIISTLGSNVNVGLMRYSALLGGPISFPVAPIDAYVDDIDTNGAGNRILVQQIVDSVSEAYEQFSSTAASRTVTVAPATIQLTGNSGTYYPTMGLRFDDVEIPQGVVLTGAQITFYGDTGISTAGMSVTIKAENSTNAAAYSATAGNLTSRGTMSTSVTWSLPATTYAVGNDFNTPDISSVINPVLAQTGWCGGNAISLIFTTTSAKSLKVVGSTNATYDTTNDGSDNAPLSALAPKLTLTYSKTDPALSTGCNRARFGSQIGFVSTNDDSSQTTESGNPNQPACKALFLNATPASTWPTGTSSGCGSLNKPTKIGMRFTNLTIPQGSTILSAFIDFTAYAADTNTPTLSIQAENASNPNSYASTGTDTVGNRFTTPGVVSGSVSWPTTAWTAGSTYTTPDLKALVQSVVNRSDWSPSANALSFFVSPSSGSGQHSAYASDGSLAYAPVLRVQISGPASRLTVRQYLQQISNAFIAKGGTPTMGVLYEAARYFRGEAAFYGRTRSFGETYVAGTSVRYPGSSGSNIQVDGTTDYAQSSRISSSASFDYSKGTPVHNYPDKCSDFNPNSSFCDGENWSGTTVYKSPITDGCQSNNIVLLSDGLPNVTTSASNTTSTTASVSSAAALIKSLPGGPTSCAIPVDSTGTTQTEWQCGNELVSYLFTKDQSSAFGGTQFVRTYTIAFSPSVAAGGSDAAGAEFLRNLATNGGGQAFTANSVAEVVTAFKTIVGNILSINTTFVAPAVTVNTFNRLTNRNELYFAVFRPDTSVNWKGNLKKYRLFQTASDSSPQIYDSSNPPLQAVDSATGYFKDGTTSFWSASADGSDIAKGGAASNLTNARTVYTYVGGTAPSNVDLTASTNALATSNASVTAAMLGLPATATATDRTNLISWARGVDVLDENGNGSTSDARQILSDPLHSEPVLINYGGTDASPDIAIYMGTNAGGLHAFNAATGAEYFSFLPQDLLLNLNTYYTSTGSYLTRPYGMDGPITSWVNDGGDGVISGSDTAYIYAGERRGGRNYYALNVTNRAAPKLMFQITGGSGSYQELGQTWSRAVHAKIRIANTNKDVLIFSGGYDPGEDGRSGQALAADSMGRALFVADATTGALLWWAGYDNGTNHPDLPLSNMIYSVPGSPRAIDLDNDGLVDRIYMADAGGQVFRIVLGKDASGVPSLTNATGSRIAALSGTTVATARRFYNAPDVAMITQNTSTPFLSISLGTGYHEHPLLQENEDRFYILRDPDITNNSPSALFINGDADLYNATSNLAGSSNATTAAQAKVDIASKKGIYISFGSTSGEKVMSESSTFSNQVLFATFQPGVTSGVCSAVQGLSRIYQISITDATPTQDFDNSGTITTSDRSKSLKQGGLPPNPTVLFPSIGTTLASDGTQQLCIGSSCLPQQATVCVGAECFQSGLNLVTTKTSWRKIER